MDYLGKIVQLSVCILALGQSSASTIQEPSTSPLNDVSPYVETIGNPFIQPDSIVEDAYARNLWDMAVFDGRLYLGSGNSNNEPPASNAGPIQVWYYDASANTFDYDYTVDEEQIDQFVEIGDQLFIPGHDATSASGTGNIYAFDGSTWLHIDNLPDALHVYDVHEYEEQWFAAIGNDTSDGVVVLSSSDQGQTWQRHYLPVAEQGENLLGIARAWEFFEVGNDLLVSVLPPSRPEFASADDTTIVYHIGASPVYRLNNSIEPQFEEMTGVDFFEGYANFEQGWIVARVAHPVRYGQFTVYLGVDTVTDHNWTPFGLFSVDEAYAVRQYTYGADVRVWDLIVEEGVLYALAAQETESGWIVSVQKTCDLNDWEETLRFNAPTFARSFALYNGDFYFGQGTEAAPLMEQAGDILRVQSPHFQTGCP